MRKSFGEILKEKREARNWSKYALAKKLNCTIGCITNWEEGRSYPNYIMLWCMADLFECSIDELVGRAVENV